MLANGSSAPCPSPACAIRYFVPEFRSSAERTYLYYGVKRAWEVDSRFDDVRVNIPPHRMVQIVCRCFYYISSSSRAELAKDDRPSTAFQTYTYAR